MMFKRVNIGSKITALVLTLVALAIIAISFIANVLVTDSLQKQYTTSISTINQFKKNRISDYFASVEGTLENLERSIIEDSVGIEVAEVAFGEEKEVSLPIATESRPLDQLIKLNSLIHHIYVISPTGRITYASSHTDKKKGESFYELERANYKECVTRKIL